jgi:agmatine deiminase
VDWRFNNYGNKHSEPAASYSNDSAVAKFILDHVAAKRFAAPLVLEGGSIHTDGEGTLLTSEQCLLNPNRNPGLSREQIEEHLREYLGVSRIIWLGRGLQDDDTDGHVDNLACFVRPGVVMALTSSDPHDENYDVLQDNLARLRTASDASGRSLQIIEVEQPQKRMHGELRLAMSYINFYLANGAVIMPAFNQPEYDDAAARVAASAFPDREIVQVPGIDIIKGGGNVHCITQQQPSAS